MDLAIGILFNQIHRKAYKPPHVLCHGFQKIRGAAIEFEDQRSHALSHIHGLSAFNINQNVNELRGSLWSRVLGLMGKEGLLIMLNMLLYCGIYISCGNTNNFRQLSGKVPLNYRLPSLLISGSGKPLGDLPVLSMPKLPIIRSEESGPHIQRRHSGIATVEKSRSPSSIVFVRQRMLYARAALNANGKVALGLRHIRMNDRLLQFNTS